MKRNCTNCRLKLDIEKLDYSQEGCKHTKLEGFCCLAFAFEGQANWMVGLNPEEGTCECYSPNIEQLKPCPFCGSKDIYITDEHGYLDYSTVIFCNSCKTIVKIESNDQEGLGSEQTSRAVEAWNRRQ